MARCPNCNKFVPLELQEPEVNDLKVAEVKWEDKIDAGSMDELT